MRTRALYQWERLLLMRSGPSTALTRSTVSPEESAVVFTASCAASFDWVAILQNSPTRESVLFIGTQFSNLYTAVDTPARGRVGVCVVFVCKYVLGHSRVSQPLNLRLCLLRHLGFLTSPHASPTCRRRRLNSYRLLRRSTPGPPPIPWAHLFHLPVSPRPLLYTPTMTT